MKKLFVLLLLTMLSLSLGANLALAFDYDNVPEEPPYNLEANCGGGCHIQLGLYLEPQKGK